MALPMFLLAMQFIAFIEVSPISRISFVLGNMFISFSNTRIEQFYSYWFSSSVTERLCSSLLDSQLHLQLAESFISCLLSTTKQDLLGLCEVEAKAFENVKNQIGYCGLWCGSCVVGNGTLKELTKRYEHIIGGYGVNEWAAKDFDGKEFMKGLASIQALPICQLAS